MNRKYFAFRRVVTVCAVLFAAVAVLVALSVVPAVESDVSPGAAPERAVPAFRMTIGLNLLAAAVCLALAMLSRDRRWTSTTGLVVFGLAGLAMGLALVDAALAFRSHDPSMQPVARLLFLCAAFDALAGTAVVAAALARPGS